MLGGNSSGGKKCVNVKVLGQKRTICQSQQARQACMREGPLLSVASCRLSHFIPPFRAPLNLYEQPARRSLQVAQRHPTCAHVFAHAIGTLSAVAHALVKGTLIMHTLLGCASVCAVG